MVAKKRKTTGKTTGPGSKMIASTKGKNPAAKGKATVKKVSQSRISRHEATESDEESTNPSSGDDSETNESDDSEIQPINKQRTKRAHGSMPTVPRTEHVDDKTRKRIRQGKFVDFKSLIAPKKGEKSTKKFTISEGLFEEVEDNTNMIFYKWIDAYVVFMSVRLDYYPEETQGMLRHLQVVKRMHAVGKDGVEYDYQLRRLKATTPDIEWGEYLSELASEIGELRIAKKPALTSKAPYKFNRFPGSGRQRICDHYNLPKGCTLGAHCRFAHKCKKCFAYDHPAQNCNRK